MGQNLMQYILVLLQTVVQVDYIQLTMKTLMQNNTKNGELRQRLMIEPTPIFHILIIKEILTKKQNPFILKNIQHLLLPV
jgi:hypothetical protein